MKHFDFMNKLVLTLAFFCVVIFIRSGLNDLVLNLKLEKALPVEGLENVEPSGLTIYNNRLFTVSDDHDDTIFRINFFSDKAVLEPYIKFEAPTTEGASKLDFEGITCDDSGNFYLVSESAFKILRVSADGKEVSWVTQSLKHYGEEKGLFQKPNANLEGIALVDQKRFVVCAEREPRGIIELDLEKLPMEVRVLKYDETTLKMPKDRPPDFSGLSFENETLYVLERGAHSICKLIIEGNKIIERDCWSYASIENNERLRYADMRYGHAEGLCMNDEHIFLILDNNGNHRYANPEDRRPLLFIIERPKK